MVAVRKANLADTEIIAQMLFKAYQEFFPGYADSAYESYLEIAPAFIKDNVNQLYVAVENTVVLGYMLSQTHSGACLTKPLHTVQQLYVQEDHRFSKAAYELLEYAKDIARSQGAILHLVLSNTGEVDKFLAKRAHILEARVVNLIL